MLQQKTLHIPNAQHFPTALKKIGIVFKKRSSMNADVKKEKNEQFYWFS